MGQTSTRDPDLIRAEYDAMDDKRCRAARVLRTELEEAVAAEGGDPRDVPPAPPPVSTPHGREVPQGEILAPDISCDGPLSEKSAVYWCGIRTYAEGDPARPYPPLHAMKVGGVTFTSWYRPWEGGETDEPEDGQRGKHAGTMIRLSVSQVEHLKAMLRKTIVRWRGRDERHSHGYLITILNEDDIKAAKEQWALSSKEERAYRAKAASFRFMQGDEPVARYLYCVLMPNAVEGSTWRPSAQIPKNILETGIESP